MDGGGVGILSIMGSLYRFQGRAVKRPLIESELYRIRP